MKFQCVLPGELRGAVEAAAADWTKNNKVARLWQKDATLWTNSGEEKWLGWTDIAERQRAELPRMTALAAEIASEGLETVVLLGMGGSSLCPEVLSVTFGRQSGFPELRIVDSTDPAQVAQVANSVNFAKTLVVVASKSGSTLEPNVLKQYFLERMRQTVGAAQAGRHFVAITDPGSKMEQVAKEEGFRAIFYGDPQVGGRFSALSPFGLVPAALAGLNLETALLKAGKMTEVARKEPAANPAVQMGLILGLAALAGRDKLTLFTSPEIYDLGAWMEQLIAESTGKQGKGVTPVDREAIAAPELYGQDRLIVYIRLDGTRDSSLDAQIEALEAAGLPVVRIGIECLYCLFGQFLFWEVATAVAGSVMELNPFDQPDVESAKIEARALTTAYEETGKLPERAPILEADGVRLYATPEYAARLQAAAASPTLVDTLKAHFDQIQTGDYFAVLAFLPMFPEHEAALQSLRHRVRAARRVATCLGFGPRFLHSTGQDYKGGQNNGVFLQITADKREDLAIPGQKFSFGVVIDAQAAGDQAVLEARGRRALRVHLGADLQTALAALDAAVAQALSR